ncbi:MAG: hypothetical protein AMXMBFR7_43620 [Planctomycetota bacterium]
MPDAVGFLGAQQVMRSDLGSAHAIGGGWRGGPLGLGLAQDALDRGSADLDACADQLDSDGASAEIRFDAQCTCPISCRIPNRISLSWMFGVRWGVLPNCQKFPWGSTGRILELAS